ncbi:hypothetical protein A6A25_16540 [Saccharothrix sp. CB00851]|nr:hypothetical protein A6A25_16540 [Saccharothrix sp. CB00851]
MAAFEPRPLDLRAVAQEAVPSYCGGGMLECPPFRTADETSTTALTTYLTAADHELVELREITRACADDYQRADGTSAEALVKVRDAAPLGPAPVFAEAVDGYRMVPRGPGGDPAGMS